VGSAFTPEKALRSANFSNMDISGGEIALRIGFAVVGAALGGKGRSGGGGGGFW
jgi:hypothetical protein